MARQTISPVAVPNNKYPTALTALTFTVADPANKEQMALTEREILIIYNSGATSHTVTINSIADVINGRTGDLTAITIAAGAFKIFPPAARNGWMQSNGYLNFEASDAEVKYAVLQI